MHRMKCKSEAAATSRGHFLLPDQFDLDVPRDTIEVGRDINEMMHMIGRGTIRHLPPAGGARFLTTPTFNWGFGGQALGDA